ncbi:hypothetical protein BGZ68_002655 [Mortierella alpina]|nr:hypothetical protein BGZ68_002655 [Mortierella alpina]
MHLDHIIPWNTISKNFSVRKNDKLSWDGLVTMDFNPREKPNQKNELLYLSNALANAIEEFSATERRKYPNKFPAETTGKVFSDELLQKRLVLDEGCATNGGTYLTSQNQRLEFWIRRARAQYEHDPDTWLQPSQLMYSTNDLDLADAAKILIIENDMSAVLTLARHPLIPFRNLISLSWGHSFGINRLVEYCLHSYIYLNILAEFPKWCQKEEYRKLEAFKRLENLMTSTCDGDAQMTMHHSFYCELREPEELMHKGRTDLVPRFAPRDIFADMGRMKEYLKLCFAVLYRYDMMVKECGEETDWMSEIAFALQQLHVDLQVFCTCYTGDCELKSRRNSRETRTSA